MPRQGLARGFKYGRADRRARGTLVVCVELPSRSSNRRSGSERSDLPGKDKEAARQRALEMFPSAHAVLARKKDHGRAEAALIALFGIRTSRSIAAPPGAQPGSNIEPNNIENRNQEMRRNHTMNAADDDGFSGPLIAVDSEKQLLPLQ